MTVGLYRSCGNCEYRESQRCGYFDEKLKDTKPCAHWKNDCIAFLSDKVAGVYPITVRLDSDEYLLTKAEAIRLYNTLKECVFHTEGKG